jgi:hypothetical protein
MLVKTGNDKLAHIRKPGTEETWCGQPINVFGSTRDCEICDQCLDAVIQAEQDKSGNRRVECPVG